MSRTRETVEPLTDGSFQSIWKRTDGGQPSTGNDAYVAHLYCTPKRVKIVDEPKVSFVACRKSPALRRRAFKPVLHVKHSIEQSNEADWYQLQATQPTTYWTGGTYVIHAVQKQISGTWSDSEALARGVIEAKIASLGAPDYRHYDRWQMVKPSMASRANLTVFLLELKDIKRMWDILPNKHFRVNDWRKVLGYLNGQHLNWEFGWKPFLGDIRKTLKAIDSFQTRLDRFISNQDQELRRRFTDKVQEVVWDETYTHPLLGMWRWKYEGTLRIVRASSFDFSYVLPKMGETELRVRAYLDSLGLDLSIANLWEVIPWSFVVDWFWNVGGFLQQFSTDWVQPEIQLDQAMYSEKVEVDFKWSVLGPATYGSRKMPGFTSVYSRYTRQLGMPRFSGTTESLDADKIRLGASLLLGRLYR